MLPERETDTRTPDGDERGEAACARIERGLPAHYASAYIDAMGSPRQGQARRKRDGESLPPKWQVVENVVAACERIQHSGLCVEIVQQAMLPVLTDPSRRREIDVFVRLNVGGRVLTVGVEVRARGASVDVPDIGSFIDKRDEVGLDRLCVVSTTGFTAGATSKAAAAAVQLVEPDAIDACGVFPRDAFVETCGVRIAHVDVVDRTPAQSAWIRGVRAERVKLVPHEGGVVALAQVLNQAAAQAVTTAEPRVPHEADVSVDIDLRPRFRAIRVGRREGAVPPLFRVSGRCVRTPVEHLGIRLFGLELATFVLSGARPLQQWTLGVPAGGGHIAITRGPARPRRTRTGLG